MITKNYIKMCEGAEEIQKIRKEKYPIMGDHFLYENENFFYDGSDSMLAWDDFDWEKALWLPNLEQLFDMIGNYKKQVKHGLLSILVMKKYKFQSLNELVLFCVMELKYSKIWTGSKWVKAE